MIRGFPLYPLDHSKDQEGTTLQVLHLIPLRKKLLISKVQEVDRHMPKVQEDHLTLLQVLEELLIHKVQEDHLTLLKVANKTPKAS